MLLLYTYYNCVYTYYLCFPLSVKLSTGFNLCRYRRKRQRYSAFCRANSRVGVHHCRFHTLISKCKCIVFEYVNRTQYCIYDTVNTTTVVVLFWTFVYDMLIYYKTWIYQCLIKQVKSPSICSCTPNSVRIR